MNVYDFDYTIYNGDSTLDFYFYCLKEKPMLLQYIPEQMKGFILYKFRMEDKTHFKSKFFSFLQGLEDVEGTVRLFWDREQKKIKSWYLQRQLSSDVIISASPEFLLKEICMRLNISNLIASEVDFKTGEFLSKNCYGEEKVTRFQQRFPNMEVDNFYSDSHSDEPMAKLAKNAFLIKNETIMTWMEKTK